MAEATPAQAAWTAGYDAAMADGDGLVPLHIPERRAYLAGYSRGLQVYLETHPEGDDGP